MKKLLVAMSLFMLLSCGQEGPVHIKQFPEHWREDQMPVIVLDSVRASGVTIIGFWVDTIIRGGMRPKDTLRLPKLSGLPAGKHTLYLDFFRGNKHIQRIERDFIWEPAAKSGEQMPSTSR